jgi:hypothetical protein
MAGEALPWRALVRVMGTDHWLAGGWWMGEEWPRMCQHGIDGGAETCDCGRFARVRVEVRRER